MTSGIFGGFLERARKKAAKDESDRRMKIAERTTDSLQARLASEKRLARAALDAGNHRLAASMAHEARSTQMAVTTAAIRQFERSCTRTKY